VDPPAPLVLELVLDPVTVLDVVPELVVLTDVVPLALDVLEPDPLEVPPSTSLETVTVQPPTPRTTTPMPNTTAIFVIVCL